jgi:hypothetical protein
MQVQLRTAALPLVDSTTRRAPVVNDVAAAEAAAVERDDRGPSGVTPVPKTHAVQADTAVPPEGSLPSSRQALSALGPGDRAAIAGATGYRLTPTGEIANPGGIPPWSFILGYAESVRAARAGNPEPQPTAAESGFADLHMDVLV